MCAEVGSRGRAQLHHLKLNVIRLLESGHPQATGSSLPETRNEIRLEIGLSMHPYVRFPIGIPQPLLITIIMDVL